MLDKTCLTNQLEKSYPYLDPDLDNFMQFKNIIMILFSLKKLAGYFPEAYVKIVSSNTDFQNFNSFFFACKEPVKEVCR